MLSKIVQKSKYLAIELVFIVVYGLILYYMSTWLAGYSLLYAYLGNLALISSILIIDEYGQKRMQSKEYFMQILKKNKDAEKSKRALQEVANNSVSFKTDLYLLYIFILIISQITSFYPTLVGENFGNFVLANSYSILLLIAFDMLIGQFSKDREKMAKISAKLEEYWNENQDQRNIT